MTEGRLGEPCKAFAERLAHDVHDNALPLHLHLRATLIGWMSQWQTSGGVSGLVEAEIRIPCVDGISTCGCLDTRTRTTEYNRTRRKDVKRDFCAWFDAIARRPIHAKARLAILEAKVRDRVWEI